MPNSDKSGELSIVIPCHNEEGGIEEILRTKHHLQCEVIVVDNNSSDRTSEVAKKYGATVAHEKRMGYGYALGAGFSKASGDFIVTIDGDNSYPLLNLDKMLAYMEQGNHDFVSGCRYPLTNKNAQPAINKIANYFISWLVRALFKIDLLDSQSGMMVFKKDVLRKINIQDMGGGFSWSAEIKIRAFLDPDINCGETHITYLPRVGKVKFKIIDGVKNLCSVLSLFITLISNKARSLRSK